MKKSTGIVRKVDELGRITLPSELRESTGIQPGNIVELSTEQGAIVVGKPRKICAVCRSRDGHPVPGIPHTYLCPKCAGILRGMKFER